jgi:hypothetical protein
MEKKLVNTPETCVEDMVSGLLYANPKLLKVEGFNAVVRSDINEIKDSQVTLLSGRYFAIDYEYRIDFESM